MANLRRYDLVFNPTSKDWALKEGQRTVLRFVTKERALIGGVLEEALGADGGTVRIHRENGVFDEERTFPRSADPRRSPG